jgi:hypothetical protein
MVRLSFGTGPFAFAHRAFCARLIRLRANADTPRCGVVELRPPPNLPRTERAASTCRSSSTRLVLVALNSDTKPASPISFAMNSPSRGIVVDGLCFMRAGVTVTYCGGMGGWPLRCVGAWAQFPNPRCKPRWSPTGSVSSSNPSNRERDIIDQRGNKSDNPDIC